MNNVFLSGGRVLPPSQGSNNKTCALSPFSKSLPKSASKIAATTIGYVNENPTLHHFGNPDTLSR